MKPANTALLAIASVLALTLVQLPARSEPDARFTPAPLPPEQALFAPLPQHDPRIAAGLSVAVNGAGQFYNHESAKGWWCLAPVLAYPAAWLLDAALGSGYIRFSDTLLIVGAKAYSAWDAYHEANRPSQATPRP